MSEPACPTVHVVGQVVACLHAPGPHDGPHEYRPEMYRPRGPVAAPEPRSTPGPSTGTPEPSQAASEWIATSHTPPSLDQPVRREAWFDGYRAAREDACLDVCSGEVARLREVVELVRVGVSEMLAAMCPDPKCGHGECDAYATVIAWLREVVHPSDGPAPDEATR